jgi:VanZ family protein
LVKISNIDSLEIKNADKFYHTFSYFVLAFFWLFSFYEKPQKKYIIVILCIIFGIIIEILQNKLTAYRTGDVLDVLANTFGIILALFVFNLFSKKNQIN